MNKNPIAVWTGYADDEEVKQYMDSHNEDAEEGDTWDMTDAKEALNGDNEYWAYQWEGFCEYLTELMKGTLWRDVRVQELQSGGGIYTGERRYGEGLLRWQIQVRKT